MMIKKRLLWPMLLLVLLLAAGLCTAQAEGAQISGKVWVEKELNGLLDEDESGLAYAEITLEQRLSDGTTLMLATCETGRDGLFAFAVSEAGEYRLNIQLLKEYQFAIPGLDSAALPAQGHSSVTPFFAVSDGQLIEKNIGATRTTCYVSIYAFEDENTNGGRMQTEAKIRGVLAELIYDHEGEEYTIASVTTDRNGEASIRDLSAGTYRLRVTLPDNYMIGPIGQKVSAFYNCVLAGEGQVGYTAPFTIAPKGSQGLGIGTVRTGSLTGSLWMDDNADSVWNQNEKGLENARLTLYSKGLGLTREAAADEKGQFSFLHIQPGDYELTVSLPGGMIFTRPGQSFISEIAAQHTIRVNIQPESTVNLQPIGAMDATSLSLQIFADTFTVNGMKEPEEGPVSGVSVSIFQDGKLAAQGMTDEEGMIHFPSLRSGSIRVEAFLPQNMVFTPSEEGLFHPVQASAKGQATLIISAETEGTLFTAGASAPASVSGILFEDPDNLGFYQADYARLSGFTVQAVDALGQIAAQAQTDLQGQYTLSPLMPGQYNIRFLLNDPYIAAPYEDSDPMNNAIAIQNPAFGETDILLLTPGESRQHVNGAIFRSGVVDGYVLQQAGAEASPVAQANGIPNVTVTLMTEDGEPFSDYSYGVTDAAGYFYIKGVLPGSYYLRYTLPEGVAFTSPMTDDNQYESDSFLSSSGSEIRLPTLGAIQTSSLSGKVQYRAEQRLLPTPALIVLDSHDCGFTYEAFTGEDGSYLLSNLRPGAYTLTVYLEDDQGMIISDGENSLVQAVCARHTSREITMTLEKDWENGQIYTALPASVQGLIYYDLNTSASQDTGEYGAEYRALSLWRGPQKVADLVCGADGAFTAQDLVPGDYTVRLTMEGQEFLVNQPQPQGNEWQYPFTLKDGAALQPVMIPMLRYASASGQIWSLDGTENGIAGIPVSLLNINGQPLETVTSDEKGAFTFTRLLPGVYALNASLPQGYVFARENDLTSRTSNIFSGMDGSLRTAAFQLPMGVDLIGLQIGLGAMGGIGDYAWLDENGNGMQDIGESPMPGISISLYQYGNLVATTTTNEYGFYRIANLYPGEYQMEVTMHKELKTTKHQDQFPLVASIMPESKNTTVTVETIIVPSGGTALHYDLGFQLRKKNVYPDAMDLIPTKDWRPYSER